MIPLVSYLRLSIISEFCFLPDEHGPCSDNQIKWFYDSRDGICKQFRYGGCQSNGNNFNTREECEYRCGEGQGTKLQESKAEKLSKTLDLNIGYKYYREFRRYCKIIYKENYENFRCLHITEGDRPLQRLRATILLRTTHRFLPGVRVQRLPRQQESFPG